MHTGLKFTDASGVTRTVSPANPLPVDTGTPALPSGAATSAKQEDILLALASILTEAQQYDADGDPLPATFDSLPVAYGYDLGGDLVTLTVTDGTTTWVKTYTWAAGKLTNVSGWVK